MQFIYIKTFIIVFIVRFATSFSMYSNFCNINSKKNRKQNFLLPTINILFLVNLLVDLSSFFIRYSTLAVEV